MGCCYAMSNSLGVPWCYSKIISKTQSSSEPTWMKKLLELMRFIESKNPFTVQPTEGTIATTVSTTTQKTSTMYDKFLKIKYMPSYTVRYFLRPSTPSIIEREVQDEIMCQKTYIVFLEIKGNMQ